MTELDRGIVAPTNGVLPAALPPSARPSTALLTDKYELTMLQAALADGTAHRHCVFEVFTRRLPTGRRYGVLAGTGRILEALPRFRFADADLAFLEETGVVDAGTIDFLSGYRFTGNILGYAEGEVFFPGSPLLQVEGTFAEAVLLETLVLSVLNYDSAVASAASRMTSAAVDRPCLEMGARRAHEQAAVAAARAAVIGGFAGTSNLEAGFRYGLPTIGTAAHAFTLLHDDEPSAFRAQVAALGEGTTLLVDTYDVRQGVVNAIEAAGTGLGAVRLDSGDLGSLAVETRAQLDELGATGTKIVVTSDLDEHAIASLAAVPVDTYGVGTSLVTGSGAPTCGMVYKLVARANSEGRLEPVAKASAGKPSRGGRKSAARRLGDDGRAVEEVLVVGEDEAVAAWTPDSDDLRALHVPFVVDGAVDSRWVGVHGVENAVRTHRASRAELPRGARRLSAGDPALPTVELELT
ncbi:nicotinate phosphoribosyltransferase [Xylanimonas cellulosilytica DSM 15894]|uniref:Nicotinate phosphoribosyltransferase n=1 Tax=Xylanimonas cellulosilytica (strain DSM 15894 / JCM 12276 / CECT 5975 / KCTC 9989 / LMG 20990 / NBRC 107835 / XIL07) TaxID=446471 RepID=D1BZ08_XYLCX|nr:nicotinate phosphoribosyltransferase [Xylanimonas cellulosilytica]ACZ30083.1 nicotinate phosphoribosyltransferase [Xylanimonas cellulosilytica DSM 15894]